MYIQGFDDSKHTSYETTKI